MARKPRSRIHYRGGYNYQLAVFYLVQTTIRPRCVIVTEFISLGKDGVLTIDAGYAWDGASGPVVDHDTNMRASLVHDALYQLMRMKKISGKAHKDRADRLFRKMCIEDGVSRILAGIWYYALKMGARFATDPKNAKKVKVAP